MSVIRSYENSHCLYTMAKMPVVEGAKFRCDKCGEWVDEQWEIRRIVQKGRHSMLLPSINKMYCKNCTNEVWHYDVLGNKREADK